MIQERASSELQLSHAYLGSLARSASHRYKTYTIPKRDGRQRTIHHPAKPLKSVQRWLLDTVLSEWPVSESAHAYVKGRGIVSNARQHRGNPYLLRLDLTDFFPSLGEPDIHEFWRRYPVLVEDWSDLDKEWFTRIVCRQHQLTIGAPTSPSLSNSLCYDLDQRLSEVCTEAGVTCTRYADDLFFSCRERGLLPRMQRQLEDIVEGETFPANLRINREKTHHASGKGRRVVTGLVLTCDGEISVGRALKRRIRSQVYNYADLDQSQRQELAGYLAYIRSVEPAFINRLVVKYGPERVEQAMSMVR